MGVRIRTVFQCAHRDRIGDGTISDAGAGQNPDLVSGPLLQFVNDHVRLVQGRDRRLVVRLAHLDKVQFVVLDAPVRAFRGRRKPRHGDRRRTGRLRRHISGWSSRNCTTHTQHTRYTVRVKSELLCSYIIRVRFMGNNRRAHAAWSAGGWLAVLV